jgi:hypothetical protein
MALILYEHVFGHKGNDAGPTIRPWTARRRSHRDEAKAAVPAFSCSVEVACAQPQQRQSDGNNEADA